MADILYTVSQGDTLTTIAREHQVDNWRTIYYAPNNADFRRKRPNPDKIFPGDKLFVPDNGGVIGIGPGGCVVPVKSWNRDVYRDWCDLYPGAHFGTYENKPGSWYVAQAASIGFGPVRRDPIEFVMKRSYLTTLLFRIDDIVAPRWFGVAVKPDLQTFSNANIFFHPAPGRAGMKDDTYNAKERPWLKLFHYMEDLGRQLAATYRSQVLIMPYFMNGSLARNLDVFPNEWEDIVSEILRQTRDSLRGSDSDEPVILQNVVTSSFSFGIQYMTLFLRDGKNLSNYLREVWDFDGHYQSPPTAAALRGLIGAATLIQYDQGAHYPAYHEPLSRWSKYHIVAEGKLLSGPPKDADGVHARIPKALFYHAASISNVGAP
jgi:hypothetical protein